MAEATQQKTEESIEDNMLVSWFEARFGFVKPYYKTIAVVAALLFLAAILFMFLQKLKRDNYANQWQDFNNAFSNYLLDRKPSHLVDFAELYPNGVASNWAYQIAGDIVLREGLSTLATDRESAIKKIKKAKSHYQAVVDSKIAKTPMLEERAVFGLGYSLESLGDFDEAGKYYSQLVERGEDSIFEDAASRGLARASNPALLAFYEDFETRKMGLAPGVRLATRPELDFSNFILPEGEAVAGPEFMAEKKTEEMPEEKPKTNEPKESEPEETTPEVETIEPEPSDTETEPEPEVTEPEVTEPEVTEAEVTEPEVTEAESGEVEEEIETEPESESEDGEDN